MRFSSKKTKILTIFILILFFLFFDLFQTEVKNLFYLISSPIQKKFWHAGIVFSDFLETISEIKNLKKENEELKLKIEELIAENVSLKELKKENETLREALNLGLEKEFQMSFAQILGKDVSQDLILIDKGSKDGIKIDFPVITQQKVLVGKISQVYSDFSKVRLLTSKDFSFDAKILAPYQTEDFGAGSEKEIYGLAKGKGNFKLSLEFIPKEKEMKVGEKVVTAALGGNFPKGLLVGEIETIKKSDIAPFQEAEIKPAFSLQDSNFLLVITNFVGIEK